MNTPLHDDLQWDEKRMEDYDGLLLIALDSFLEKEELPKLKRSVLLGNKQAKQLYHGLDAVQLAWTRYEQNALQRKSDPIQHIGRLDDIIQGREDLQGIQGKLEGLYDRDTVQLIEEGRLRVLALIRSRGGLTTQSRILAGALTHWKKNKGHVTTICSEYAASAGAVLGCLPRKENRSCTPGTSLMFHQGSSGLEQFLPPGIGIYEQGALQKFLAALKREMEGMGEAERKRMMAKIQPVVDNPYGSLSVRFSDDELREHGLIRERVPFDNVATHLEKQCGITMTEQAPEKNPLSRFLVLAQIQHDIRMQFGLEPWHLTLDWDVPEEHPEGKLGAFTYFSKESPDIETRALCGWNAAIPLLREAGFQAFAHASDDKQS